MSRALIGKHEGGCIEETTVGSLRRHAEALGLRVEITLTGRGGQLARMTDEEHAAIVELIAKNLVAQGWMVEPEASFNHFGERGRFDLLAYHAATGILLIVEVKTELTDLQEMFGSLNVKERLAARVAEERGWNVSSVSTLLAIAATPSGRKIVEQHSTLFSSHVVVSNKVAFAADPQRPRRALLWILPQAGGRKAWRAGRRRVRKRRAQRPISGRAPTPLVPSVAADASAADSITATAGSTKPLGQPDAASDPR
jgi:hypothetical protein